MEAYNTDSIYLRSIYGNSWIYNHVSKKLFTDVECKHCFNVHWWNPKYTAVILALLNKARAWNHDRFYKKNLIHLHCIYIYYIATTGYSLFLEFLKQNKHFFCKPRDDSLNALLYSVFVSSVYVKHVYNSIMLRASRRYCVWRVFFPLHKNCLQVLCTAKAMKNHI